jgi:hypothetical protein
MMPNDFPVTHYETIIARVRTRNGNNPIDTHVLSQFLGAWNGVAYRFRTFTEHDSAYTDSVNLSGTAPPLEERYKQERELFGFFVTGLAVIESIAYGLFAIGAMLDAPNFLMQTPAEMRKVSLRFVADRYAVAFSGNNLTTILSQTMIAPEFIAWSRARNILAHRASPGRLISCSATFGSQTSNINDRRDNAIWTDIQIQIDKDTTATRRIWIAKTTNDILDAAASFTNGRL